MAPKKIPAKAPVKTASTKRKQKNSTQKPAMQRVAIMGPTGKLRMEWRPWI